MQPKKICAYSGCNKKFVGKNKKHMYCSERCAYLALREKHALRPKECKWCNTPTYNKNRLCSEECEQAYAHSKETNKKKSKADYPSLEEVAKLSREAGLSYGYYVGKMYLQKRNGE